METNHEAHRTCVAYVSLLKFQDEVQRSLKESDSEYAREDSEAIDVMLSLLVDRVIDVYN